jgi:hypothetical protein
MSMKYLRAVVTLPYATPEGRIVTRPGWDEETQLYLHLPYDYTPRVPNKPTPDMIRRAVLNLVQPWSAYTFASPDDAAGMVSGVLAAVCRPVLDVCPAYLFDACQQASGKTKAALALGSVIEGERSAVTPYSASAEEEVRKRLVSGAMEGSRFSCLDNITGFYRSAVMAAVLTSGKLSDRVLGQSRTVSPTIRALMTLTGNNASLDADLMRRTVAIRIDAGVNPAQRVFPFDPVLAALNHRMGIAEAACTIWRGFFNDAAAGAGGGVGGFDQWAALCRNPVTWMAREGLADNLPWQLGDPAASMLRDPTEADPEIEDVADLLRGLWDLTDGRPFLAEECTAWWRVGERMDSPARAFREAVCSIRGPGSRDEPSVRTFGRLLANRRDRVVDGLRLLRSGSGRQCVWRVLQS